MDNVLDREENNHAGLLEEAYPTEEGAVGPAPSPRQKAEAPEDPTEDGPETEAPKKQGGHRQKKAQGLNNKEDYVTMGNQYFLYPSVSYRLGIYHPIKIYSIYT